MLCVKCGGVMVLTALIQDDRELGRILAHQGWPVDFPKPSPARALPAPATDQDDTGQSDPSSFRFVAFKQQEAGTTRFKAFITVPAA